MSAPTLDGVPAEHREVVRAALADAFGTNAVSGVEPVIGGASGALTYRLTARDRQHFLRLETRRGPLRNPHQYACMQTAAGAGIAPPLVHADADAGIAIMQLLPQRPLTEYPGGPAALARDLGALVARLQATDTFPALADYFTTLDRMLDYVQRAAVFAPGLLDPHREAFRRIREAYPWNPGRLVSSHNDPNPRNIIFDGQRLWLVDWETAQRNDPFTDVAILVDSLAPAPELQDTLLRTWLGHEPAATDRARLLLMRQVTRLYYAALGFSFFASVPRTTGPDADLSAPTPEQFRATIASGQLSSTGPATLYVLGKMCLASFFATAQTREFDEALLAASAYP